MAAQDPALQQLLGKQDRAKAIEQEILAITTTLDNMPGKPGIKGPLVDKEGFPRADVDVHEVRNLRNRIAYLQTDHVALMKEVEQGMLAFYAQAKPAHTPATEPGGAKAAVPAPAAAPKAASPVAVGHAPQGDGCVDVAALRPFALIDQVSDESPAHRAGLRVGDGVLSMGHVTKAEIDAQGMAVLAGLVGNHENRPLAVHVLSEGEGGAREVSLTPCRWAGQGLLGCHLAPL